MRHLTQRKQLTQAATYSAMVMMLDSDCDSDLEDYYQLCRYQLQKRYLTSRNTATDSILVTIYQLCKNPQRDPSVQLAVATCRLGSNGAAVTRLKTLFNIGYGTINLYTMRFIKIIYKKKSLLASWPTQEERLEMSQVMQDEGFPGCVGFVDGTTIPLSQKPPVDGNHYFDRKKRYSISLTLVCDINKKFVSYLAGYPGSCHDSYVFSNMRIAQQPNRFFDRNQYLLADSAYTSDRYTVPAYKGKELLESQNVDFNYRLAQSRVRIKHAIGILKGRFSSLRKIRCQLRTRNEMKGTIKWIITCIVLHNSSQTSKINGMIYTGRNSGSPS
ncbi:hypothetical protein PSHT_15882 [Puccinia striiformis]|uniref:DDE Tnp4 domain-containing protein n=1 Tax=Puccinia striiformis TaxID=27350 RepID=A0A2S4UCX0_9BASI|nr:hypothetical protein PSHT_15882 [Puccinia striiformis]